MKWNVINNNNAYILQPASLSSLYHWQVSPPKFFLNRTDVGIPHHDQFSSVILKQKQNIAVGNVKLMQTFDLVEFTSMFFIWCPVTFTLIFEKYFMISSVLKYNK